MRLNRLALFVVLMCMGSPLLCQELTPVGEFNVGYSAITDFDFTGHGFNLGLIGSPSSWFGIEGQFDGWFDIGGSGVDMYTTVGGPRFSFRTDRVTPFVHFLAGGAYTRLLGKTDSRFVIKYGGGIDVNFGERYAWRFEVNDLWFVDPEDHNLTASTGFVLRWQ